MRILAGLELSGAAVTAFDDLRPGEGAVGAAVLSPAGLLGDLELRLGVGIEAAPVSVRVAAWAERMSHVPAERFFSKSFAVDPLGTARAVLELRDELVEAGWAGEQVTGGGPRLEAVAELEQLGNPALPPGDADRLAALARAVERADFPIYEELCLAEPEVLWPACFKCVFAALARHGTLVRHAEFELPGAAPGSDLRQVQFALSCGSPPPGARLSGDGSFVVLEAETSWEAARATAALVDTLRGADLVIVREQEAAALDLALRAQGLPAQGWASRSPFRAATQVLPLALELAFEPKDPYRVLELLTLPIGPFQGSAGHRLARALEQSPGIGSPAWLRAKRELNELSGGMDLTARIDEWIEHPGADAMAGAPKAALLAVVQRVSDWLRVRIAASSGDSTLLLAWSHAAALWESLEADPRATLGLVEVRRVIESVVSSAARLVLGEECAGRIDHVASPSSLQVPREVVIWWCFAGGNAARPSSRWRAAERLALVQSGFDLPDPRDALAARARGFRRAIHAATQRVVLVVPRTSAGKRLEPHPLWDEITATSRIEPEMRARVTVGARELLDGPSAGRLLPAPPRAAVQRTALPGGFAEWQLRDGEPPRLERLSASSLSDLLGCPLKWALKAGAGLREGGKALPRLHQLNGTLGHRLVQCLHEQGAFDQPDDVELERRASILLPELIRREGAVLLRPGMAFERAQLESQLVRAAVELHRTLRASGLRILAVEKDVEASFRGKTLSGRIDLLAATEAGVHAIFDVKWGFASYDDLLQAGRALQLAFYGFVHAASTNTELPAVAYFSLSRGRLLALPSTLWPEADAPNAPALADTWRAVERSLARAEVVAGAGRFPVSGVRRSLPLLEAFGVALDEHPAHYAPAAGATCEYCGFDALCGRRWEAAS